MREMKEEKKMKAIILILFHKDATISQCFSHHRLLRMAFSKRKYQDEEAL